MFRSGWITAAGGRRRTPLHRIEMRGDQHCGCNYWSGVRQAENSLPNQFTIALATPTARQRKPDIWVANARDQHLTLSQPYRNNFTLLRHRIGRDDLQAAADFCAGDLPSEMLRQAVDRLEVRGRIGSRRHRQVTHFADLHKQYNGSKRNRQQQAEQACS